MDNPIRWIRNRITRLENRVSRQLRFGVVKGFDPVKDEVELSFGQGDPVPAKVMAMGAGNFKIRLTPSVGQTMIAIAPDGDARRMVALYGPWTGRNKSPSDHDDEMMIERGEMRTVYRKNAIEHHIGEVKVVQTASGFEFDGNVKIKGDLDVDGGVINNDGVYVGKSHEHTETEPGDSLSGPPPGG